ncbi:glycosyltransferase family 2 protein [Flavobacterium tyrosinilyticum]|uniref:glycosyltransferase family 2 protein n=1 Tax=Flavobacterium tyrosinilyticum TaxID=1658740 RepID=UPI00202EFDD5|nr:glycosyltransferase family A protein [Flavobacterium tyrosinilyticum]MCM0668643.1 glycosyltransferase family 2 protein [Flavobacterium tyrosinilyticum]
MNNPLVSIIVPCYKQSQYLDESLQSVLDQTYENWECIIVNDGSPDNTEEEAKKWILKDTRFKYVYSKNKGVSHARNLGIATAKGELILPLDADDKIGQNYIKKGSELFQENPSLKLVYCLAMKFGDENGEWNLPDFSLENLSRDNLIFCSALYKKTDWYFIGGYDEQMKSGLEDWEFWISLLKNGGEVVQIKEVEFYYRIKKSSRQTDLTNDNRKSLFEYMSIKHADFFVKQLGTFKHLDSVIKSTKSEFKNKLQSKKFVIDLFCTTFFHFSIFGLYKKNK